MHFSSHEQALGYWFGRTNFELSSPLVSDLKLDRMRALLHLLGNPQDRLRIIHVAGSKGKGSTAAMLAAILRQAGYRTGLFTSPHLSRVEERIQIDGQPIEANELTALLGELAEVEATVLRGRGLQPTFFELATALGFLHFARRRVEVAVVEVGLGGRFDSTNVCQPMVSLITSISLDHTQQLGDRLASIAMEKAGIIKPGRPAISGATAPEARTVIAAIARDRQASLCQLGTDFSYSFKPGRVTAAGEVRQRVTVVTRGRSWPDQELGLLGEHQAANAAIAVACVEELGRQGLHISQRAVAAGLAGVHWPARMEVLGHHPLVVLDCAHNVASAQALVDTLETSFPRQRRMLILAVSADKDLPGMLRVLAPHFHQAFLTRYGGSQRGAAPEHLAELLAREAPLPTQICADAGQAWQAARALAGPDDLLCITGSVFLAGELRPIVLAQREPVPLLSLA